MTNEELIKALRGCKDIEFCTDCSMLPNGLMTESCHIKDIAADALEEAEKRIAELVTKCRQLESQLPKEGEWAEDEYGYIHCSKCGMEWDEPEHPKTNFCPSCGARMNGGQE